MPACGELKSIHHKLLRLSNAKAEGTHKDSSEAIVDTDVELFSLSDEKELPFRHLMSSAHQVLVGC